MDIVETLDSAKQWCGIFKIDGKVRHGTSDAPFKAAAEITRLRSQVERVCAIIDKTDEDGFTPQAEQDLMDWRAEIARTALETPEDSNDR